MSPSQYARTCLDPPPAILAQVAVLESVTAAMLPSVLDEQGHSSEGNEVWFWESSLSCTFNLESYTPHTILSPDTTVPLMMVALVVEVEVMCRL